MMDIIPYGRHDISHEDIQSVIDVLGSDYLTQGPVVPAFEEAVAQYCKVSHSVAMNSATSALHIACLALGVGPGDLVWTTPITFVASANCALYCGAAIDFVDIDPRTYNMSYERLAEKLEQAEMVGKLPKLVIPVHMCGQSCDMAEIYALGQRFGFKIIEDASHAIGGKYRNEPVGNCSYSDITVFSFHPVKIITSGEGGMATTNNAMLAERMRLLRSHGITNDKINMLSRPKGEIWNYQQITLGFNYRMTDIHAALGLSQMNRLDEFVVKRHLIAGRYSTLFADIPVVTPWQHADSYSSFHLYPIRLKLRETKKTHCQVFEALRRDQINVNLHYIPVYRQPYFERMGFRKGYCTEAEQYFAEVISIPIYFSLCDEEIERVYLAIKKAL